MAKLTKFLRFFILLTNISQIFTISQNVETNEKFDNAEGCHKPADIIFVLDSSLSIYGPDFKKQLAFTRNIINDLDISPSLVRVGLLTYGDRVRLEFGLLANADRIALSAAVSSVSQLRGDGTRTDLALDRMRETMAEEGRPALNVSRISIVITDGQSDYPRETRQAAERAHREGIAVFAVGIGRDVDRNELKAIAGRSDLVFNVDNYDGLKVIRKLLTTKTCEVETQNDESQSTTTARDVNVQYTQGCKGVPIDVFFVLDGSGSIWRPDFERQLSFVRDMVALFQVSETGVHVGVMTFGDTPLTQFNLDDYSTVAGAQKAVSRIVQPRGGTNTADALQFLRLTTFNGSRRRHREGAEKMAIVITDGRSDYPQATLRQAALLGEAEVILVAIGVGSNVDESELYGMASHSPDQHVFIVNSYSDLQNIKMKLVLMACLKKNSPFPPPPPLPPPPPPPPHPSSPPSFVSVSVTNTCNRRPTTKSNTAPNNSPTTKLSTTARWTTKPTRTNTPATTLTTTIPTITDRITQSTLTTTSKYTSGCHSAAAADIVFSLPSTISDEDTRAGLQFLAIMADRLDAGSDEAGAGTGIRMGMAPRLCHSVSGISLEQGSKRRQLSRLIESQRQSSSMDETAAILRYVRDVSFSQYDGARGKGVSKVAVVIVDGNLGKLTDLAVREADRLKKEGIKVMVIVVGNEIESHDDDDDDYDYKLIDMVSCSSCLIRANNYEHLSQISESLTTTIINLLCSKSELIVQLRRNKANILTRLIN